MKAIMRGFPQNLGMRKGIKGMWILKFNFLWTDISKRQNDTQASMTVPTGHVNICKGGRTGQQQEHRAQIFTAINTGNAQ